MSFVNFVKKRGGCVECPLEREVCVPPEGNIETAKLILVGQNPGPEEREDGHPFIGPCGRFLFPMLEEVCGITREDCYITNTMKCTNPNTETIAAGVYDHCFKQWSGEWAAMAGKRVLLLGGIASKKFFRTMPKRGTFIFKEGTMFLQVYHPAWSLYSGNHEFYRKDLELVNSLLRWQGERQRVSYDVIKTPNALTDFVEFIDRAAEGDYQGWLSFDIETNMVSAYEPTSRIISIAFSDGISTKVIDWDSLGIVADVGVAKILGSGVPKLAQNAKFELTWLRRVKGIKVNNLVFDPMVAQFIVDEGLATSVALKQLVFRHFPEYAGYDSLVDISNLENEPKEKVWEYNATDAFLAWKISEILSSELERKGMSFLFNDVLMPTVEALSDMEEAGLLLDKGRVVEEKAKLSTEIDSIETLVKEKAVSLGVDVEDYNIHSTHWLRRLFFEGLKLEPIKMTAKGNVPSLNYEVLGKFSRRGVEEANLVLQFRGLNKIKSTYYDSYETLVSADGYLHPNFSMVTAITGRLSCWNPNIQNVPSTVQPVFPSRFDDGVLMNMDFKQMELRIVACESKDKGLIEVFLSGEDPHAKTASLITGIPVDKILSERKDLRGRAKATNFGIIYGMTAGALAWREGISVEAATEFYDGFFHQFSGVKAWQEMQKEKVRTGKKITSFFGRIWDFSTLSEDEKVTRSFNYPIQSAASDVNIYVMTLIGELIKDANLQTKLIATVHDSLLMDCPRSEVDKVKEIMHVVVAGLPNQFGWMICPMAISISVGETWADV